MKNHAFMTILLLLMTSIMTAQSLTNELDTASSSKLQSEDQELTFVVVEKMPEFPGGSQAMMKYIGENIKYPALAQKNNIQGRVVCQFVIDKDGSVTEVEVVRTSGDISLDAEAVRVVSSMPKWAPGIQRGKAVRVKYTTPINFRLGNGSKNEVADTSNSKNTQMRRDLPQFPGGFDKLNAYIKENIRYPRAAYDRGIRGKTVLEFWVDVDGSISDVHVVESATFKSLDDEAIRLVRSMPKWLPALQNGEPVKAKFRLPIGFGV